MLAPWLERGQKEDLEGEVSLAGGSTLLDDDRVAMTEVLLPFRVRVRIRVRLG